MIANSQRGHPRHQLLESVYPADAGLRARELKEHFQGEQCRNKSSGQGCSPDHDPVVARHKGQEDGGHERAEQNFGQWTHRSMKNSTSATPSAKRKAYVCRLPVWSSRRVRPTISVVPCSPRTATPAISQRSTNSAIAASRLCRRMNVASYSSSR